MPLPGGGSSKFAEQAVDAGGVEEEEPKERGPDHKRRWAAIIMTGAMAADIKKGGLTIALDNRDPEAAVIKNMVLWLIEAEGEARLVGQVPRAQQEREAGGLLDRLRSMLGHEA